MLSFEFIKKIIISIIFLIVGGQLILNNKTVTLSMLRSGGLFSKKSIEKKDITHKNLNSARVFVYICGSLFVLGAMFFIIQSIKKVL